jgi:hypothetical protein
MVAVRTTVLYCEDYGLVRCDAVLFGGWVLIYQRFLCMSVPLYQITHRYIPEDHNLILTLVRT